MPLPYEEQEFMKKYWFNGNHMITVINPRKEDFQFQMKLNVGLNIETGRQVDEDRYYVVKSGETERFPGTVANYYLDQMSKYVAQDEEKIGQLVDFTYRAGIYDQLIVQDEDLIRSYVPNPDYLEKEDPALGVTAAAQAGPQPFAGLEQPKASKSAAKA